MAIRVNFSAVDTEVKPWLDAHQVYSLFNQDKIWIDRNRNTYTITEIDDDYLLNLHRFVKRHYRNLRLRLKWAQMNMFEQMEAAWFGAEPDMDDRMDLPVDLMDTPLFSRLHQEVLGRGLTPKREGD